MDKKIKWLRRAFLHVLLLSGLLLSFSFTSAYASLLWRQSNGPYGGYAYSIGVSQSDPRTIYLGTEYSGIYVSTNSGESWAIKNNGLLDLSIKINDIVVNPYNSREAYAATNGNGVAKTSDGGESWSPKNNNLGAGIIYAVAMDPKDTNNIYAAMYSGVRKSSDGGDSWSDAGLGGKGEVTSLKVVSAGSHSVIYAGTFGSGLWRSTDEAQNWTNILTSEIVTAIGVSRSSPEAHIYAAIKRSSSYTIKLTKNGGAPTPSWTNTGYLNMGGDAYTVKSISVNASSPEVAYAATGGQSIWKTTNESAWIQKTPSQNDATFLDLEIDPGKPSRVYACGVGRAFYLSTNEGASWTYKNTGINNAYVQELDLASSESGPIVYAGTRTVGIFRSTNEGGSWEDINRGIASGQVSVYALAHDPVDLSTVYAGTSNVGVNSFFLYRSHDRGSTWEAKSTPSAGLIYAIAVDPVSHEVVYIGTTGGSHFYRSLDSGESFAAWDHGLPNSGVISIYATSFEGKSYVFAGFYILNGPSIYRRRTDKATWEATNWPGGSAAAAFAPNYATPEALYASIDNKIYLSTLEATTPWVARSTAGYIVSFAADPATPSVIYGSSTDRGIWKVSNFGASPVRDESGLETTHYDGLLQSKPLALDTYSNPRVFFADVNARSVWTAEALAETIPDPPSFVVGTAESSRKIRWTWVDNSLTEQGFRLYAPGPILKIDNIPPNTTSTSEGGLDANKAYRRSVAAFRSGVPDQFSPLSPPVYTLANVPGTPEAKEIGWQNITITWEANGNPHNISLNITSYEVYRSTTEAGSGLPIYWQHVSTVLTTEYPDTGLTFETTYYYRVRALNGNGFPTIFVTSEGITTAPPVPSLDIFPPTITNVRFDGRAYFENDIIYRSPRITAIITDYASHEPDLPPDVTPEGVSRSSVVVRFGDWTFGWGDISDANFTSLTPTMEAFNFAIPTAMGSTNYVCSIEATDRAFGRWNRGSWTGRVRVMGERVEIVGQPLTYPAPYRPLTQGNVTFSYTLSTNADVAIYMYDISGQILLTKKFGSGSEGGKAGYNQFSWTGRTDFGGVVANGIYVYKIVSKGRAIGTGKLVVLD